MSTTARDHRGSGHLALVVCHPGRIGGMETFCRCLVDTALGAGWRITVALSGENIYDSLRSTSSEKIRVDRVNWLDSICAGDREYDRKRIRSRRAWFRCCRPDVAVFVQSSNTPFRSAVVGARLAGVPVISTHRTMAWPVETVPSRRHCFGLLPGVGLHGRRVVFKTWVTALLASRIVYNSAEVRAGYEAIYGYPARKGVVIPNAVAPPPAVSRPSSTGRCVTVGFAGRLGADKRLDVLLQAVAGMRSRDVRMAIYGEGTEQAALAQLAGELGIASRVEWRGVTQDRWSAYADMDIVALCSPRESSSNMVLEAMAAGKAVVVSDAGGMPELVDHGRCGLCVPPLDVDALTRALDALASNPELRCRLGERARSKALHDHDARAIGRAWRSLLSEVAGEPAFAYPVDLATDAVPESSPSASPSAAWAGE